MAHASGFHFDTSLGHQLLWHHRGNHNIPQSETNSFIYVNGSYLPSPVPGFLYAINDRGDLLSEQPGLTPRLNIYRDGVRLTLQVPETDYVLFDISNTGAVGVLPATLNADGCYEGRGFMVGLPE